VQHGPDSALYVTSGSTISRIRPVAPAGGVSFGITAEPGAVVSTWATGTSQAGYYLLRVGVISGNVDVFPPGGGTLSAETTAYTDLSPQTELMYCYLAVPVDGSGQALGLSDMDCLLPGTATGPNRPTDFTVRLDQSNTARLTCRGVGGQLAYLLFVLPLGGGPPAFVPIAAGAMTTSHDTGGALNCYSLIAVGDSVISNTDFLCPLPGIATPSGSLSRSFPNGCSESSPGCGKGFHTTRSLPEPVTDSH